MLYYHTFRQVHVKFSEQWITVITLMNTLVRHMTKEFGQRYKWYNHDILIHKLVVT